MADPVLLFDLDGTLTEPRKPITASMKESLAHKKNSFELCVVSGSNLAKIKEQLGEDLFSLYDYIFAENGLSTFHHGQPLKGQTIIEHIGEENVNRFTKYCLDYIAKLNIPVKTSTFVELRKGLINVSPIGRDCTQSQRDEFAKYDQVHKVRQSMIEDLKNHFTKLDLKYSIGGQISFDVFPIGWDKTYCLKYLPNRVIHFFGDKTMPGGNDFEIFHDSRVIGHAVGSFRDTIKILNGLKA
jgi:phosphomannomutase